MNETFFTSDIHFSHKLLIDKQYRSFPSIEEHDETIIENWNKKVSKRADVYILGDISFAPAAKGYELIKRLNGNLNLIYGNHDGLNVKSKELFKWRGHYRQIKLEAQKIILFHFPIYSWNGREHGSWHLHGHLHASGNHANFVHPRKINVNIELHDYKPLHYDEVKEIVLRRSI